MFAGRLADRHGRPFTIIPGISLMAVALALLIGRVQPEQRGLAASTYFTGFDAGTSIGAIVLGMVSQTWGFGVVWPIAAACTLLGLAGLLG